MIFVHWGGSERSERIALHSLPLLGIVPRRPLLEQRGDTALRCHQLGQ